MELKPLQPTKQILLSFRRFEFKYPMPKAVADRIIPQIMNYMVWDPYVGDKEYYNVYTLYMDSPNLKCYHEKLDGLLNRKKVRVRSYGEHFGDGNVFFELKRKSGPIILKDRRIVDAKDLKKFSQNPFDLIRDNKDDFWNEFLFELSTNNMRPVLFTFYKRKPFFSMFDRKFRVTFDYDLYFTKAAGFRPDFYSRKEYSDTVIMEVKFNGAMPRWFHDIIEMYGLTKDTFSKYCYGVEFCHGVPAYF